MRAIETRAALLILLAVVWAGGCGKEEPQATAPAPAAGLGATTAQEPVELTAYVPCGMTVPFHEALDLYEAANPGITVAATYDNDAELLRKVREDGDRPDVFVSPGGRELAVLAEDGLIAEDATVEFGSFEIVAVLHRDSALDLGGPEDLTSPSLATIALPDPDLTSIGWHVRQSLQQLGLWEDIQERIVPAGRIIEAYEQVIQRKADLTFTYRGCPLPHDEEQLAKTSARIAFSLSMDSYDMPTVTVGVLNTSTHAERAAQLAEFLATDSVVKVMVESGLPDERGVTGVVVASAEEGLAAEAASDAEVYILAFYPDDEGHAEVRAFIEGLPEQFPGQVEVELHDFRDPEADPDGFSKWKRAGFGCAGLLVNGKNTFEIDGHEVILQRKMGVQWQPEELVAAVESELQ